jgi:hypothetical protein
MRHATAAAAAIVCILLAPRVRAQEPATAPDTLATPLAADLPDARFVEVVYVTPAGRHFHRAGCRHLRRTHRRVARAALGARYSACRTCDPLSPEHPEAQEPRLEEGESVRCTGTTRAGQQCRRRTRNASGRCHLHDGE